MEISFQNVFNTQRPATGIQGSSILVRIHSSPSDSVICNERSTYYQSEIRARPGASIVHSVHNRIFPTKTKTRRICLSEYTVILIGIVGPQEFCSSVRDDVNRKKLESELESRDVLRRYLTRDSPLDNASCLHRLNGNSILASSNSKGIYMGVVV
jgi:hypothetical protein